MQSIIGGENFCPHCVEQAPSRGIRAVTGAGRQRQCEYKTSRGGAGPMGSLSKVHAGAWLCAAALALLGGCAGAPTPALTPLSSPPASPEAGMPPFPDSPRAASLTTYV